MTSCPGGGAGSIQKRFQTIAKIVAGAEEQAFDGGDCRFEDFGDFLVGHVFKTAEDDRHALGFREGGDSAGDSFLDFRLRDFFRGGADGGVGMLHRGTVGIARIERDEAGALAPAHFIEDEIAGDREKPGGEFGRGMVAGRALPDPDKDLLGEILGIRFATQHFCDRAHDAELMPFDEGLERPLVPRFDREHEGDILGGGIVIWAGAFGHGRGRETNITTGPGERLAKFLSPRGTAWVFFVCP